jgi:hypothetical protein
VTSNEAQLNEALRQLAVYSEALERLRDELADTNPGLFADAAPGYLARMRRIRVDIQAWLKAHATEPVAT